MILFNHFNPPGFFLLIYLLSNVCLNVRVVGVVNDSSPSSSSSSLSSPHLSISNHIHTTNWPQHNDFCGPPPTVPHAHCNLLINQRHSVFKVGEIATYSCEQGYRMTQGQEKLSCLPRDDMGRPPRWESVTIKCEVVNCGDPGPVANATYKPSSFAYNTNVEYKCLPGFRMIGVPFLTCKDNGKWNRDKPFCQLQQCPNLPAFANGNISYSDFLRRTDSKAEYICNFGYRFNLDHNIRYCKQDDKWSDLSPSIEPKCQLIACDMPVRPHAGLTIVKGKSSQQNKSVFRPGDIIIYSCRHNNIKAAVKCLPDGTWHRGPPHCPHPEDITCPSPKIENGKVENGRKPFQVYASVKFKCDENYYLEGHSELICLPSGKWNDTFPKCASNSPIISPSSTSKLTILIICISILIVIIIFISFILMLRWRQQHLERKRWQRYFGSYNNRQSKTNITFNSNEMKCFRQSPKPTVPSTDL